ncbi:DUF4357 domain-containing protein [Fusobacterium pseudoperiodonticum]|uniref:DUF4357 domain-containing protein n=1 Tax=Fusobacterium pseudoperiodonticum TaxID=2663009 RepID=UPI000C1B016F|nr:DUF4357 domain-containing protein [Fusobacterium pseudoperiodonticum]ATV69047.1 DUF4357 domain-containing protein [Fusobacterium pseudoperiodonticum]PIM78008.1 hypothetical protein CTM69_00480 [Fusobacterium pseudoperiodonticum]
MKASERKITKLFSESDTVFSIPVYQRDYNWQEKQCQRLFKDILQTGKNEKVSSYFLGSIVYIHDGIYGVGEKEFHIIDGQQRMTTLTLLFLAIYFKLKGTILAKDADKIYNQYVVNPYSEKEIKLKLLPPEENLYILNKISHNKFNELEAFQDRNMLKNYLFFEKELESLSFEDMKHLSNGIEKLIYIDIALEKGKDDPQKIFESLNSTGLDLSQGDLIRNYILMDLERGEQNRIYKEIWIPIENNCKVSDGSEITSYVSDFIRDYLTLKTEKISSKPKVFETFKAYYEKENDEKLEDMKKYSEAYSYIIKPILEKDRDIQRELDYLKSLDKTVINTFLIGILKDYKDNILEKDELVNMLILLQSYLWRRYITEKPTNALNKIFQGMYGKISRSGNYYENLVDVLMAEDFPTDEELESALKLKNVYKDKEKLNYVFKKLENYNHNELIDFENEKITIEHIFPQKPNKAWKENYSDNELEQMISFKDTISNLTLTGSNSNLSNKAFHEKRDDEVHGYRNSKLYMNKYLGRLEEWNLLSMEARFESLYDDIIKIWKRPEDKATNDMEKITFVLKGKLTSGKGRLLSNEKFEILKGTSIVLEVKSDNPSTFRRNKNLIEDLIRKNLIEKLEDRYVFKENYIATSPSAAAILVLGRSANGWTEWKTYEGKLLSDYRK